MQNLPNFKGKRRLVKFLYGKRIDAAEEITIAGKLNCKYLVPNLQENVGLDIFVNGVYEEETIDLLRTTIPNGGIYLDLGANIGAILVPLCKTRPDIQALAVEAAPWIYKYLDHNVSLNQLKNVQLINNALFHEDDKELNFFSPRDKYGKGSLAPVFSSEPTKVITKRVDTLVSQYNLQKVDVIKIDVEGFEHFVFRGAQNLLSNTSAPDIIFEFVDWAEEQAMGLAPGAAQQLLKEMGYRLYKMEGNKLIELKDILRKGACNLLASKKNIQV